MEKDISDGGVRPVSASRPAFYPGPMRLAACAVAAGFSQAVKYPKVTDAKGTAWTPSGLQVILAIAGAESSGNAFAYHLNASDGSMDHGPWQVNDAAHPGYFTGPGQLTSAYNPWDAAVMAWEIHVAAGYAWTPWMAYAAPGAHWLGWRDQSLGETWMHWAADGITALNAAVAAGKTLLQIATADLDEAA